jgi:glutamate-1-semialdehyde 2,1-aminomutase
MTRKKSEDLYKKACELMPGGVSSPVRAFKSVGGTPVYYQSAQGSRFKDEDGNQYTDYCMSWGPLILGHAHPAVIEAVEKAAKDGLSYGACCRKEIDLAELVLLAFGKMEQVRFVNSGTEAVMTAIRLARGITGRTKILKFIGGYHGHSDSLLVRAGSGLVTFGTSSSQGVPDAFVAETVVCPLDSEEALETAFKTYGNDLAAAIVEPLPANNGLLEQRPEWLKKLRQLTEDRGALLIFDEVISGFRLRFGGYGDSLGIDADLITLGKIIGGGMPVGAVAGSREIMQSLAPLGGVYQAGTLSGNPVSLAAGIATLELLSDEKVYEQLESLGQKLDVALEKAAGDLPFLKWRRLGSVFWLHLAEGDVPRRADRIRPESAERYNRIHPKLLDRGIYLAPSAYEVAFLSAAHTQEDAETLAREVAALLKEIAS